MLNSMITLCDEGETRVQQPLLEIGIVLPSNTDSSPSTLITDFFHRLPSRNRSAQAFGAEVVVNLQLLAQHVELKARLAADEALIVGLDGLNQALDTWSEEWRTCGRQMGKISFRTRLQPSPTQGIPAISPSLFPRHLRPTSPLPRTIQPTPEN